LIFSKLTFEESLGKLRALGLDGFELYHPFFYKNIFQGTLCLEPKVLKDVMALVKAHGLKVVSVNAGNNFVQPDNSLFRKQVEGVKACVDVAMEIGCPVVRVFGGEFAEGKTEAQCIGAITEGLRQSAVYAEEGGVTLALENHGRITNNIDTLTGILKEVGSESLKVNLDTGNFYWFGYKLSEVEAIFKKLAPITAHTHMKNGTTDRREERRKPGEIKLVPLPEGDIDLAKTVKLLKAKGYKGVISMEDEFEGWTSLPLEKVMEILKKDVDYLRVAL